jgi:hypothetical protein
MDGRKKADYDAKEQRGEGEDEIRQGPMLRFMVIVCSKVEFLKGVLDAKMPNEWKNGKDGNSQGGFSEIFLFEY